MGLSNVPADRDIPNDVNVVIEIPMHGNPIKYEVYKETGAIFVDRFMSTPMYYPVNYGYSLVASPQKRLMTRQIALDYDLGSSQISLLEHLRMALA